MKGVVEGTIHLILPSHVHASWSSPFVRFNTYNFLLSWWPGREHAREAAFSSHNCVVHPWPLHCTPHFIPPRPSTHPRLTHSHCPPGSNPQGGLRWPHSGYCQNVCREHKGYRWQKAKNGTEIVALSVLRPVLPTGIICLLQGQLEVIIIGAAVGRAWYANTQTVLTSFYSCYKKTMLRHERAHQRVQMGYWNQCLMIFFKLFLL